MALKGTTGHLSPNLDGWVHWVHTCLTPNFPSLGEACLECVSLDVG
jgi:hypothetical protein